MIIASRWLRKKSGVLIGGSQLSESIPIPYRFWEFCNPLRTPIPAPRLASRHSARPTSYTKRLNRTAHLNQNPSDLLWVRPCFEVEVLACTLWPTRKICKTCCEQLRSFRNLKSRYLLGAFFQSPLSLMRHFSKVPPIRFDKSPGTVF